MANQWFRLYSEFANDPKIQRMSEALQRRFIMLLCIRCSNGDVTLHDDDVTFQLRISNDEWNETKAVFLSKNLIDENNNPVAWDKRQFSSDSSTARVSKHREKLKQACNVSVTPQNRTEQIQNIDANASVPGKPETVKSACPADEIISLYHESMPLNPRCRVLNEARRKTIRARWREAASLSCQPFGYSTREGGIAAWRQFFEICAESDFLTGKTPALAGRPPFIADIDFLMSPSGFAKCLENKYHREAA